MWFHQNTAKISQRSFDEFIMYSKFSVRFYCKQTVCIKVPMTKFDVKHPKKLQRLFFSKVIGIKQL